MSPKISQVKVWNYTDWSDSFAVNVPLEHARAEEFNALLLQAGVINPDQLRTLPKAVAFVKAFFGAGKPVAWICHVLWTIIEAGEARGRRLTSSPSHKIDLQNAGSDWVSQEVCVNEGLVTSRKPNDIPAFNQAVIRLFASVSGRSYQATAE